MQPSRHRWSEEGYTLVEVAIAAVPLALIALSLFAAFAFTVAFARRGERQVEAVQQARQALTFLAQELRETSTALGGIVVWSRDDGDTQDGVGFLSARVDGPGRPFVIDPAGSPNWQHTVYYLRDASGNFRRVTSDLSPLALPASLDGGRILVGQVKQFHVTRQGDLLTITVVVGTNPTDPSAVATLRTAVRPRN